MFQGFNKAAIGSDAVDSCTCTKRVSCFSKSHDTNHVTSVILHVIATLSNPSAVSCLPEIIYEKIESEESYL